MDIFESIGLKHVYGSDIKPVDFFVSEPVIWSRLR